VTLTDAQVQRPGAAEPSEKRIKRRDVPAALRARCVDCARASRGPASYQAAGLALLRAVEQGGEVLARVELRRLHHAGDLPHARWRAADGVLEQIGIPAEVQQDVERGPVPA
jgi:hypothetical protein